MTLRRLIFGGALSSGAYCASSPEHLRPTHGSYDVAVVGAGIVGLATAREIQKRFPSKRICVIDKEDRVAAHQSSHNSGVIHAGMYYKPGSVMAHTCVRGADLMYQYCETNGLPFERVGKLIVASEPSEDSIVQTLYERGTANGVKGLEVLTAEQVKKLEPNVVCTSALHSPNTGIADFAAVASHIADGFRKKKGDIHLRFAVDDVDRIEAKAEKGATSKSAQKIVRISGTEDNQQGPQKVVHATNVITCCGLQSDYVSRLFGGEMAPSVVPVRGRYYELVPSKRDVVKRNIYPVPNPKSALPVGIHFTPTCNVERGKQMIVGPGAAMTFAKEGYSFKNVSPLDMLNVVIDRGAFLFLVKNPSLVATELYRDASFKAFVHQARKLVPSVTQDDFMPSFAGVMMQVFDKNGAPLSDYLYETTMDNQVLNLRYAPSPAATASLAIAEHCADKATETFGWTK